MVVFSGRGGKEQTMAMGDMVRGVGASRGPACLFNAAISTVAGLGLLSPGVYVNRGEPGQHSAPPLLSQTWPVSASDRYCVSQVSGPWNMNRW